MKVSVIIATYNSKELLVECLDSLENQDYKNFEVIVVDDGSTDGTADHLKKLKLKIKMKLLQQNRKGPAAARNLGVKNSGGKIVFFTDADCIVPRNWLSSIVRAYEKYPNLGGVGGILEPNSNNVFAKVEKIKNKYVHGMGEKEIIGKGEVPVGFTNNMSYNKEKFNEFKGFDETFSKPSGEDSDFKNSITKKYDVMFLPIKVKHNESYDLNYFLRQILKRGTEKKLINMGTKDMIKEVVKSLPIIFYTLIKKTNIYRKTYNNLV